MTPATLNFAEPQWLWLAGLGPAALLALQLYAARARRRQLAQMAAPEAVAALTRSHSLGRRRLKDTLLLVVLASLGLALARPQWGQREITTQNLSEDIVFALDVSRSMLAADVAPNRLDRAKQAVQDFVRKHTNGRVGLVAFAGQAFLQCPLTFDHGAFEDALKAVDDKAISVPGTDVGRALDEAFQAMEKMDRQKVVVLLTDGEDLEQSGIKKAQVLAEQGVVVFTVGVGTAAGAEIRVADERGGLDYVRDAQGQIVRSRLDEESLRAIAGTTGGGYEPLGALGEGLGKVRLAVAARGFASGAAPTQRYGVDRFHWLVALGILVVVMESLVGTRRRLATMMIGLCLASAARGMAAEATNGIPATHPSGGTNAAPERPPESPREFFNAGTRRLQGGQWREAEALLQQVLATQNDKLQPAALHNLGHVRYAQGAEELKKSPDSKAVRRRSEQALAQGEQAVQQAEAALAGTEVPRLVTAYLNGRGARKELREAMDLVRRALEAYGATLQKWQRALDDFRSALELNPADAAARENVKTIEAALARLLDKMQQLAQLGQMMGQMRQDLGELMSELRGQIPAPEAPPGDDGEEADEDDAPNGPREGQEQRRGPEGEERGLTPEEAGWLLESFKLGGNRQLPMNQGEAGKPRDRKGKNW